MRAGTVSRVWVVAVLATMTAPLVSCGARGAGAGARSAGPLLAPVADSTDSRPVVGAMTTTDRVRGIRENEHGAAAAVEPPAGKMEGRSRGCAACLCVVHFDNRTDLHVRAYVDDRDVGSAGPWGDVFAYALPMPVRLTARAELGGDELTWGPIVADCSQLAGGYKWRLYPPPAVPPAADTGTVQGGAAPDARAPVRLDFGIILTHPERDITEWRAGAERLHGCAGTCGERKRP